MKLSLLKYIIIACFLAVLILSNLANPTAFANTGDQSFNSQTYPTRTPQGGKATSTPKPAKEPTDTPVPPPTAVRATVAPATSRPTATPQSTNTPVPTAIATTNATQLAATIPPLVTETPTPLATPGPTGTPNNLSDSSTPATGAIEPSVVPTISSDSSGNASSPFFLIGGAALVLLIGLFLVFGRSKTNDRPKPQ